jgi:hypothetical protein
MNVNVPIQYMGFWDVPLVFLARHQGQTYLFDCPFDEELDDYLDRYRVYLMPSVHENDLPKDWTTLSARATRYLGDVAVKSVRFDPTGRQSIDAAIFDEISKRNAVAG